MKKLLLASCAAVAIGCGGTAAQAADIGLAGSTYDWSGGYMGVNVGAGFNNLKLKSDYTYTGSEELDEDTLGLIDNLNSSSDANGAAFTGGVLAGYNMQISNFVLGVEGDFNYINFEGKVRNDVSDTMNAVLASTDVNAADQIDYQGNWYGTVRARLGYAMDNFLFYGTGGLAYGELSIDQSLNATSDTESVKWDSSRDAWRFGWTLGAGMEYAIDRWTVGLEYLYVDLGTFDWDSNAAVNLGDETASADWSQVKNNGEADYAFSVARASMKYRF